MNKKVKLLCGDLKRIIKDRNMERFTKRLYQFSHLNLGFIAHYNLGGFKHTYYDGKEFLRYLENAKNNLNVYVCDETDNYNYGYTNQEVKEAFAEILTDQLLSKIESEVNASEKQSRHKEYIRLKAEFGSG